MIRLEWADSRGVYWVGLTAICMMVWFSFAINKEATRYRVNTWTSILTVKLTSSLFVVARSPESGWTPQFPLAAL